MRGTGFEQYLAAKVLTGTQIERVERIMKMFLGKRRSWFDMYVVRWDRTRSMEKRIKWKMFEMMCVEGERGMEGVK